MKPLELINEQWRSLDSRTRLWCGYALIALLATAVGWTALDSKVQTLEKKRAAREGVLKEMLPLKLTFMSVRQSADKLKGRMSLLRPDDSLAKIIEETGIKGKSVKIVPAKGEEHNGFVEEAADVRIEGLTLNEVVNLLYRLENGSRPLSIKKCNVKVRLDDPARSDLNLTLALLKPAQGQAKQ